MNLDFIYFTNIYINIEYPKLVFFFFLNVDNSIDGNEEIWTQTVSIEMSTSSNWATKFLGKLVFLKNDDIIKSARILLN